MRHRLSPRETVVVAILGTTTVDGEPPSGGTVDAAAAICGCCAAAISGRLDAVVCVGTDAVTRVSGTVNGTSVARACTVPEFAKEALAKSSIRSSKHLPRLQVKVRPSPQCNVPAPDLLL